MSKRRPSQRQAKAQNPVSLKVRRWEAAETNRLNKVHWSGAQDQSVNYDINLYAEKLRARCAYEAANNPTVSGVIETHVNDVVGKEGPTLQVQSSDTNFNEAFERVWRKWWRSPDVNGRLSGAAILRQWVRMLWISGEFFSQKVNADRGAVRLRLQQIHPRRVISPFGSAFDNTFMGVRLSDTGRPLAYHVANEDFRFGMGMLAQTVEVPADQVIHGFNPTEPGQIRGVPILAPALGAIADCRDFDQETLDAARAAANQALYMWTTSPEAGFVDVNEEVSIQRRTLSTLPPGWQLAQLNPNHPSTTYVEFRGERQRDIGRPVGMPLLMVRLDSSNHNYSSARFDGQVYQRGLSVFDEMLECCGMNPLALEVAQEAYLSRLLPAIPDDLSFFWQWPKAPHVDPLKEALAATERMSNGTSTLFDELAALGKDPDAHLAQLKKEKELREKGILPALATAAATAPAAQDEKKTEEDDDEPEVKATGTE